MTADAGQALVYERPLPSLTPPAAVWKRVRWPLATIVEFVLIIAFWEIAVVQLKWVGSAYLSPPSAIATRIDEMVALGYLQENLAFSIQNFVVGYLIAASVGLPFGLLMGSLPVMNR